MTVKLQLQNKIINGSFDYFQRGTSFAAIADGTYTADRFIYGKTGTMVHTVSRSSDVAADASGVFSLLATPTTIQASILAGSFNFIGQRIEGNILRSFKSKKMVLTFKVKAFKTGVYCLSLRNNALDRSLIKEYTVDSGNTWETKVVRFTHDASGSWLYDTGVGMRLNFVLAAGTTFQTTPDVWQTGNFLSTSNQVNGVDSLSNTFQISDVCLVEDNDGATRTPDFQYAGRDIFEELQICQRYFEKSYNIDVKAGQPSNAGVFNIPLPSIGNGQTMGTISYKVEKRVAAGVVFYGPVTGFTNQCESTTDTGQGTNSALQIYNGLHGCSVYNLAGAALSGSAGFKTHWTADAEL